MAQIIKADGSSLSMGTNPILDIDKLRTKKAVLTGLADRMTIVRWEEIKELTPTGQVIRLRMEAILHG